MTGKASPTVDVPAGGNDWYVDCNNIFTMIMPRLEDHLSKLAAFEPRPYPVISLYLNTQRNEHGRDQFQPWLRKELAARARTFEPRSSQARSFETDRQRIHKWLDEQLDPATNGVVLFASAGADQYFEAIQLNAPIERNELYVQDQPHLYALARLIDQYPRYAAVLTDTNSARIFVFGLNQIHAAKEVQSVKTRRTMMGGWSQARFQRRVDNFHRHHAKEVVERLDRIVRDEGIHHIVLAGDHEVVIPLLKEEMPKHLQKILVDVLRLDLTAQEHVLLKRSMEALRADDARRDADKVEYLLSEYRSGGLAAAGVVDTLSALDNGQVEELILAASPSDIETPEEALAATPQPVAMAERADSEAVAALIGDALVTRAQQTSAKVCFIENSAALAELGGCGALLRYRM
jgi:peptide subunit release factor 1 (eRF1)